MAVPAIDFFGASERIGRSFTDAIDRYRAEQEREKAEAASNAALAKYGLGAANVPKPGFLRGMTNAIGLTEPEAAAPAPAPEALHVAPQQPLNMPATIPAQQQRGGPALALAPALHSAILGQESGNRSDIGVSNKNAHGPGQIIPETFARFAMPGERLDNPDDNRAVSARMLDKFLANYGDPARAAVAYFSGEGNVAPAGSQTPWKHDKSDGRVRTSEYVSQVLSRMGGAGRAQLAGPAPMSDTREPAPATPEQALYNAPLADLYRLTQGPAKRLAEAIIEQRIKSMGGARFDAPYTDAAGNLVQRNMQTGEVNVLSRAASSSAQPHVVGDALVDPTGKVLYQGQQRRASLPPEAIDMMAEQGLAGDQSWVTGLGRGAQGAENIGAVRTRMAQLKAERGQTTDDILKNVAKFGGVKAGARTAGTMAAKLDVLSNTAAAAGDYALEQSAKVARTQFVPINKIVQMGQAAMSNPALAAFNAANTTLVNEYARAVGGGVGTDASRAHAMEMLNTAQSPEAYAAVVNVLKREVQLAHGAAKQRAAGEEPASNVPAEKPKVTKRFIWNPATGEATEAQ